MKIKSLLVGMLACTAMVSCTNDDVLENNDVIKAGEKGYVAVNIVTPSSANGRAAAGDFLSGTTDEITVNDAVFLFLDRDFKGCANPHYIANFGQWSDANGVGQDKQKRVLVVEGSKDEVPAYILAILNPVDYSAENYNENTTLAQLKTRYANNAGYANAQNSKFVMSNAVYFDSYSKEMAATPITLANIAHSTQELESDNYQPVTIQVERAVAKVGVTSLNTAIDGLNASLSSTSAEKIDDQENLKLKFVLTGWNVLQNKQSSLVKNVDATSWKITNWNDVALKRSYWANDYTIAGRTQYTVDGDSLTNTAFKYVEETVNQNPTLASDLNSVSPYLLVSGKFVDASDETKAIELVEWRGQKYTKDGYLKLIAGMSEISQYYTAVTDENNVTTYTSFTYDLLKLQDNPANDWGATAVLANEDTEFFTVTFKADGTTVNTATPVDTEIVKTAIAAFEEVQYWNGGNTYYFVPIKHQAHLENKNFYGVVRNHVYQMNITAMSGYGTPVANPYQAIDEPEKPTEDYSYMAAEVVILDWKVVNNDVELN